MFRCWPHLTEDDVENVSAKLSWWCSCCRADVEAGESEWSDDDIADVGFVVCLENPFELRREANVCRPTKCRRGGLMIALMAARLEEAKQDMREEGERERAFVDG